MNISIRSGNTKERKHAVQEGAVWTDAVAEYMVAMYPELLEDHRDAGDLIRFKKDQLYL
jgi:hypothetical protein